MTVRKLLAHLRPICERVIAGFIIRGIIWLIDWWLNR